MARRDTRIDDTLVVDGGSTIVGIYSVKQRKYVAYRYPNMLLGARRLIRAREVVTWCGWLYDLPRICALLGLPETGVSPFLGTHTEMHDKCWANIRGSNLAGTYQPQFGSLPELPKITTATSPTIAEMCSWHRSFGSVGEPES